MFTHIWYFGGLSLRHRWCHRLWTLFLGNHWCWLWSWKVAAPREAVWSNVLLARNVDCGEAVRQEAHLLVVQPGIGDVPQLCGRGEDLQERAVVKAEEEVG